VRQALEVARTRVVLPHHRDRRDRLAYRCLDVGAQRFHPRGRDLAHDDIAEAIEHETRQRVGFTVHEPVERPLVQRAPQRLRDLQTVHDQRFAGRMLRVATEDARADQRVRIDVAVAEEPVAIGDDATHRAGLEALQRRTRGVDFVRKHPQVPGRKPSILAALQTQLGQRGGRLLGRMPGHGGERVVHVYIAARILSDP
jgi:hypothetical protein